MVLPGHWRCLSKNQSQDNREVGRATRCEFQQLLSRWANKKTPEKLQELVERQQLQPSWTQWCESSIWSWLSVRLEEQLMLLEWPKMWWLELLLSVWVDSDWPI